MSEVRLRWDGRQVSEGVRHATARALREASEHLLTEANKTVPIETGALMRSGVSDVDEQRLEATVSYGHNESAAYAMKQHEDTTIRHDPGRRAKWLELTLNEQRRRLQQYIENEIKRALRG